ncbi:hypothetical protein, partial [Vibrio kanaloae]
SGSGFAGEMATLPKSIMATDVNSPSNETHSTMVETSTISPVSYAQMVEKGSLLKELCQCNGEGQCQTHT